MANPPSIAPRGARHSHGVAHGARRPGKPPTSSCRPRTPSTGFWFGGGNVVEAPDGTLYACGRYRNYGDSRTGLGAGERGLECAVFASKDRGKTFEKVISWSKADLSTPDARVVSIEGTALHTKADGSVEFFISSEKDIPYPSPFEAYQKPGTGVWTIDVIEAPSVEEMQAGDIRPVFHGQPDPGHLHVKDPWVFDRPDGSTVLGFCNHPMAWSSSNTGYAVRPSGRDAFEIATWEMTDRGPIWDVAATRLTDRLALPAVGVLADKGPLSVYFYDAAECLRDHEQNKKAKKRPRGYSCEELGGAMLGADDAFPAMDRLSYVEPLFVSPHGTGCSRYVDTIVLEEGILATWQQAQADGSQPLVAHLLTNERIQDILAG